MKENARINTIKRIEEDLEKIKELREKAEKLKQLEEDPIIIEYKQLLADTERLKQETNFFTSLETIIYLEFIKLFRNTNSNIFHCSHDIWIYLNSYYYHPNPFDESNQYLKCDDENHEDFKFNRYYCVECGKFVDVEDWENFENIHTVLKIRHLNKNVHDYQNLYYQLLFSNNIEEAQAKLISQFNEDNGQAKKFKLNNF